jgi:hypothetical protein
MKPLKLFIELVPSTSWYNNLRKVLPKSEWDRIRKESYRNAGLICEICGKGNTKLNCHEIWEYDDEKHIQKLKGFQALCTDCHWVKHIGLAGIMSMQGQLDFEKIVVHFMEVNEVSKWDFEKHKKEAFEKWEERSKSEWKIDFGAYSQLLGKIKSLSS